MTGDGVNDIYLVGNFCGLKPELGRMDANMGTLLKGKGDGQFEFVPPMISGLFYTGEGRGLLYFKTADTKNTVILSRNNESLKVYKN